MIHASSHSCSFYSNMTFSLHWIFTQANILLTTAKCLEVKWFSNSLPNPKLAILVFAPSFAHSSTVFYFSVFYTDTLDAPLCTCSPDHGSYCIAQSSEVSWFLVYSIFVCFLFYFCNYFCTTWHILALVLLFYPCLFCSVETIWNPLSFHILKMTVLHLLTAVKPTISYPILPSLHSNITVFISSHFSERWPLMLFLPYSPLSLFYHSYLFHILAQ